MTEETTVPGQVTPETPQPEVSEFPVVEGVEPNAQQPQGPSPENEEETPQQPQ